MIKITFIVISIIIALFLAIKVILWSFKRNSEFFNDFLKEKDSDGILRYSNGRVYLFVTITFYYIATAIVVIKSIFHEKLSIEIPTIDFAMQKLEFLLTALFLYVFGGKTMGPLTTYLSNRSASLNNSAQQPKKNDNKDTKNNEENKQMLND